MMYSKGADSVMLARLNKRMAEITKKTNKHVSYFSKKGLRTLAVCKKPLTEEEYTKFDAAYQEASASLKNREQQVEEICDRAERDFDLLGATAIEDKLQVRSPSSTLRCCGFSDVSLSVMQEGVPEAIAYFIKAGIKFWIITGDKQETAINIAKSCNLIQLGVTIVKVNVTSDEQCAEVLKKANEIVSNNPRCALVIDGGSLTFALGQHQPALLAVCTKCEVRCFLVFFISCLRRSLFLLTHPVTH
jgi:magnesium-transporting ATPase (P-type)